MTDESIVKRPTAYQDGNMEAGKLHRVEYDTKALWKGSSEQDVTDVKKLHRLNYRSLQTVNGHITNLHSRVSKPSY